MSELVDVVVTVYNKENTIQRCLDSILNQDYMNINVIIIDDGSSDKSYDVCASYKDQRIKLYHQENSGVGKARNMGISKLAGDKVVFIDADDYVAPSYISDLMKYSQFDLVIQGYKTCEEDSNIYKQMIPQKCQIEFQQYGKYLFNIEAYRYMTMLWNKLFDVKIIQNNNLKFRDISTGEDVCFIFDYLEYTKRVTITDEANYCYVLSTGSLTRRDIPDVWERQNDINNYCRKNFYPKYGNTWANMYVRAVKRTLGEAGKNKGKFYEQISKIRDDADFKNVEFRYLQGIIAKMIYILIKSKSNYALWILFRWA